MTNQTPAQQLKTGARSAIADARLLRRSGDAAALVAVLVDLAGEYRRAVYYIYR